MSHFFISHASEDHDVAYSIAALMKRCGAEVFIDNCRSLSEDFNAEWKQKIYDELNTAVVFVAMVGKSRLRTPYCQYELIKALKSHSGQNLPLLVPVTLEASQLHEKFARETLDLPEIGAQGLAEALIEIGKTVYRRKLSAASANGVLLDYRAAHTFVANLVEHDGPNFAAADTLQRLIHEDALTPSKPFTASSTYPLAHLARQLPPTAMDKAITRMLLSTDDVERILHGAYLFGSIHVDATDRSAALSECRRIHKFLRGKSPEMNWWPAVERQLTYTEAKLGDESASATLVRALKTADGAAFELGYNFRYYNRDRELMQKRFEPVITGEIRATDRFLSGFVHEIHSRILEAADSNSPLLGPLR